MSLIDDIEVELQNRRSALNRRIGARDQILASKQREETAYQDAVKTSDIAEKSNIFLLNLISKQRQSAVDTIAKMGSMSLQMIYDPSYHLTFDTRETKRADGQPDFTMELKVGSKQGDTMLLTSLDDERGGGVTESVAFTLRESVLEWLGYTGPFLIDEAYKTLSVDAKIYRVAKYLRELVNQTGRQLIFVTHHLEVFGPYADLIHHVTSDEGYAKVEQIDFDDMMVLFEASKERYMSNPDDGQSGEYDESQEN